MAFKLNIAVKDGKTYHLESDSESFIGNSIKEKISGEDFSNDLHGYIFEITGASDKAGLPALECVEGVGLKRLLLKKGKAMRNSKIKGLRRRKTIRGKVLSENISQINLKVSKVGGKKLEEVFDSQNGGKLKENREHKRKQKASAPVAEEAAE